MSVGTRASKFQSTLPLRGATKIMDNAISGQIFQSTLPLRGATIPLIPFKYNKQISIHAPLTGSDLLENAIPVRAFGFQSTLPLRGATKSTRTTFAGGVFQSTLPLRGATGAASRRVADLDISIHAPLTGSDRYGAECALGRKEFQSTLPLRGATREFMSALRKRLISIHAPLTGSDACHMRPTHP